MLPLQDPELKILLGNSVSMPEEDLDDAVVASRSGEPHAEDALRDYYFSSLTIQIGKENFQAEYNSVIDFIRTYPLEQRIRLSYSIIKRIKEVYDFEFPKDLDVNSELEVQNVLDLIKFIEYENEKLIINVWKYLAPENNRVNTLLYCEQNKNRILLEIEEQIDTFDYNPLIVQFVKSYEGDKIIKWFCKQSERLETEIKIEIVKEK